MRWFPRGPEAGRVIFLVLTMVAVALCVAAVSSLLLYHTSLERTKDRFSEMAQSHARLIEQIAEHEEKYAHCLPLAAGHPTAGEATIEQVRGVHARLERFGETGEFQLARVDGDSIVFLFTARRSGYTTPFAVSLSRTNLAAPMRRALGGQSGVMVGSDYAGRRVVAAYEPVRAFGGMGIVAKMEMAELQAPFVRAGLICAALTLVLASVAALVFFAVTNPLLHRLARSERECRAKSDELEQLIYAASHDLRTPLVGVQGFASELRRSVAEMDAACTETAPDRKAATKARQDIDEALGFIEAGVSRMSVLLSGLLRISRLGRAALDVVEVDADRAVAEVLSTVEFASREAGAQLEVSPLPACRADKVQLASVFANLIDNALKYRDPARALVVRITGRRVRDAVEYCVEDNGIGIEPQQQARVFDPFFQVAPRRSKGDGLGLTIVRSAVERLGGHVKVDSEPGKGSRFIFVLPI